MNRNSYQAIFGKASKLAGVLGLLLAMAVAPAAADTRLIVRDYFGYSALRTSCLLLGCSVQYNLGDPDAWVFLVTFPAALNPVTSMLRLSLQTGVTNVELDQRAKTQGATTGPVPSYLSDTTPVSYYGTTVWHG